MITTVLKESEGIFLWLLFLVSSGFVIYSLNAGLRGHLVDKAIKNTMRVCVPLKICLCIWLVLWMKWIRADSLYKVASEDKVTGPGGAARTHKD